MALEWTIEVIRYSTKVHRNLKGATHSVEGMSTCGCSLLSDTRPISRLQERYIRLALCQPHVAALWCGLPSMRLSYKGQPAISPNMDYDYFQCFKKNLQHLLNKDNVCPVEEFMVSGITLSWIILSKFCQGEQEESVVVGLVRRLDRRTCLVNMTHTATNNLVCTVLLCSLVQNKESRERDTRKSEGVVQP